MDPETVDGSNQRIIRPEGSGSAMQLLDIDLTHNRMHITLAETFDEPDAQALLSEVEARMEELQKGFLVLCDLTSLNRFDPAARPPFRRIMDLCNESGVGKVIRIATNPLNDFGLTVLSHFHYDSHVPVITCHNYNEASRHLCVD